VAPIAPRGAPPGSAARVLGPGVLAAYTASREGQ
jgi:hypothetical protein